jgi:microcystin-dependent protein
MVMKMLFAITLFALSLFGSLALAQQPGPVPELINYQGKLVQANGIDPLEAGTYVIRFELFDKAVTPAGGDPPETLVWGEQQQVVVSGGIFHVMLGAPGATPLVGTAVNDLGFAFGDAERFLQTTMVSGPTGPMNQTLAPRQQLASVPFAVNSAKLAGQPPSFWLPPGMISAYGGSSDPAGWLICDGRAISRTQFAELFASIGVTFGSGNGSTTFNLPNARGLVLRGSGSQAINGRTKEGPSLGGNQEDQMQKITGQFSSRKWGSSAGEFIFGGIGSFSMSSFTDNNYPGAAGPAVAAGSHRIAFDSSSSPNARASSTTSGETWVSSLGVNYIIK